LPQGMITAQWPPHGVTITVTQHSKHRPGPHTVPGSQLSGTPRLTSTVAVDDGDEHTLGNCKLDVRQGGVRPDTSGKH